MSRVRTDQKFINTNKYDPSITNPSKITRIHQEGKDYHKASTLSSWLFIKYDMTYKTFSKKSKKRRNKLRQEYTIDTGRVPGPTKSKSYKF